MQSSKQPKTRYSAYEYSPFNKLNERTKPYRMSMDQLARQADCQSLYSQSSNQLSESSLAAKPPSHTESQIPTKASPLLSLPLRKTDSHYVEEQQSSSPRPLTIRTQPLIKDKSNFGSQGKGRQRNGNKEEEGNKQHGIRSLEATVSDLGRRVEQARRELERRNRREQMGETKELGEATEMENQVTRFVEDGQLQDHRFAESTITIKRMPFSEGSPMKPSSFEKCDVYYVSRAVREVNDKQSAIKKHIQQSIEQLRRLELQQPPSPTSLKAKKFCLPPRNPILPKTIVFQLDKTLLTYSFPQTQTTTTSTTSSIILSPRNSPSSNSNFHLHLRPFAITLLKQLSQMYQLIVFTTLEKDIADPIIDFIDPEGKVFQHRLYREHCCRTESGDLVKNLRGLNRQLSEVAMVDSMVAAFVFQLENGVPVVPYEPGRQDLQLKSLLQYIKQFEQEQDVRALNTKTFKLQHYSKFPSPTDLIYQLYSSPQ